MERIEKNVSQRTGKIVVGVSALVLALAISILSFIPAEALITSSLSVGSSGAQVTELQTYLKTQPSIYPEGLVTGYYGSLTAAAVQRFQCREGIVCSGTAATTGYGRVGPQTRARLNVLMGGGGVPVPGVDRSGAIHSAIAVTQTNNSATIRWNTNELATGRVYYATNPLPLFEGTESGIAATVGGQSVAESAATLSHSVTLNNLQPNTVYYYAIHTTDASGNVQITWPTVFRTNQ